MQADILHLCFTPFPAYRLTERTNGIFKIFQITYSIVKVLGN